MSATTSSNDKFAFLFQTSNNPAFDLSGIRNTLQDYYGYPSVNIHDSEGVDSLLADFQLFADAVVAHSPDGECPDTKKNTVVIFLVGDAYAAGLGDTGGPNIDWSNLGYALDPVPAGSDYYYTNSEVHFYLIFPYCNDFYSSLVSYNDGSVSFPITNDFTTFNDHASFIAHWIDTFGVAAEDSFYSDLTLVNYKLLSFALAAAKIKTFYPAVTSVLSTFYRQNSGGVSETSSFSPFFPGRPLLEIDDGNPTIYKTQDIWLNENDPLDPATTDPDLYDNYEYDHDNKISVRVHVRGTHPVVDYYVGVGVFRSGGGGECDVNPLAERHITAANILKPGDTEIYTYTEFFESIYSHRCIKARVSRSEISDADIDNASDWSIAANRNEAQLNIDPGGVAKMATGGAGGGEEAPDQGEGKVDEENPGADAEENEDGDGSKSIKNLRGYLEHEYLIRNDFKTKMEFLFKIPDEVYKYEKLFKCRWFRYHPKYPGKMEELTVKDSHTPGFIFNLNAGEEVEILFYLALRKGVSVEKKINLPFDILVKKPDRTFLGIFKFRRQPLKLHSGVDLALVNSSGDIVVRVSDEKKKVVPGAYVYIKTLNGRQSAVFKTDKEGNCKIPQINTGPYRLWAKKESWKTGVKVVNLKNKKTERVELLPEHEKK